MTVTDRDRLAITSPSPGALLPSRADRTAVRPISLIRMVGPVLLVVGLLLQTARGESPAAKDEGEISFHRDVMAVFTKAGCNSGRCHGNSNGRGGFWLSLRGQFPSDDYLAVSRDLRGRRINKADAKRSLILLKATAEVPHEGGLRFAADSLEYQQLVGWIRGGATIDDPSLGDVSRLEVTPTDALVSHPDDRVALRVVATWSDGSQRDVTQMAVYETADLNSRVSARGLVERVKDGESTIVVRYLNQQAAVTIAFLPNTALTAEEFIFPPVVNVIDEEVFAKLTRLRIPPAPLASDATYLRRLALDLTGKLPTAEEAQSFAADPSAVKREAWLERYLSSPAYAEFWALKWADLLRVEEKTMDAKGVEVFHRWIRETVASDQPLDEFARLILTAEGSTYENPAANFYRAIREPDELAEAVAQVFLGTRLRCAKCHDHPFDRWTQDDYYGFASLFAPIDYEILKNERKDKFDKNQFIGEQIVNRKGPAQVKHPRTKKRVDARLLVGAETGRSELPFGYVRDADVDLELLAEWLSSDAQHQFAQVVVNRVWAELMGRGLVEPVDDFRDTNPPSHPELLVALTDQFLQDGYRLKPLIRSIVQSHTYQFSSQAVPANTEDQTNYSHALVRRMTAEQTLDAISQVTGVDTSFEGYPVGTTAIALAGVNREYQHVAKGGRRFLQMFGKPDRIMTCACERSNETALTQVFELTSGELLHHKISASGNRLGRWLQQSDDNAWILDQLYWTTLARDPVDSEKAALLEIVAKAEDRRQAFEDILWGLINAKEFLFRM